MRIFLLLLTFGFALAASFPTYAQAPPKRVALVIGNSNYIGATPDLPNPANDAALMAQTLRGLGFDVDVRTELSRGEMDEAFRTHRDRLSAGGPNAVGLFYYAGHGVQLDDANYLIPVSSTARFRQDVRGEPQLGTAISYMREAGNAVNIVIIDACKDSPYPDRVGIGRTAAGTGGLSTPRRSEGVFIAYAAQPGQTASDGAGENSPFAAALADVMQVPGLDLDDVFQEIASRVVNLSGGEQWPYYSSGLIGEDVCLAGCETVPAAPLLASDESTALAQAITANTLPAYELFLERFPDHARIGYVKRQIEILKLGANVSGTKKLAGGEKSNFFNQRIIGAEQIRVFRNSACNTNLDRYSDACSSSFAFFNSDATRIATASRDGTARIWDSVTGVELSFISIEKGVFASAAFSADDNSFFTVSTDKVLREWNLNTEASGLSTTFDNYPNHIAFNPKGSEAAIAFSDKKILVLDLDLWLQNIEIYDAESDLKFASFEHVTFSQDGSKIVSASSDNVVKIWDAGNGKELNQFTGHESRVNTAVFSPDGRHVLTASDDKTARIWDISGKDSIALEGHNHFVTSANFSANGLWVITASLDKSVRIWNLDGEELFKLEDNHARFNAASFSPEGTHILTSAHGGTARIWALKFEEN